MQKIYYNPIKDLTIVDTSGIKLLSKIKEEFGDAKYVELEIDEKTEVQSLLDGKLSKKLIEIPDNSKEILIQEEIRKLAIDSLKKQGKI